MCTQVLAAVLAIALLIGCARPPPRVEAQPPRVEAQPRRVTGIAWSRGSFADHYYLAHPAGDEGLLPPRAKFLVVREKGGCALVVSGHDETWQCWEVGPVARAKTMSGAPIDTTRRAPTCSVAQLHAPKGAVRECDTGPRGTCGAFVGHVECAGDIPSPSFDVAESGEVCGARDRHVHCEETATQASDPIGVNPGKDANACAIRRSDGAVHCWGAGYSASPARQRAEPVRITLEQRHNPLAAILDGQPTTEEDCIVRRACRTETKVLPSCASDIRAQEWSDAALTARPGPIAVIGRLVVARGWVLLGGCLRECCESGDGLEAAIRSDRTTLFLDSHLGCFESDESRTCWNVPAYGQPVIAQGRLELDRRHQDEWILRDVELCEMR